MRPAALAALLCLAAAPARARAPLPVRWAEMGKNYKAFIASPTSGRARAFLDVLPSSFSYRERRDCGADRLCRESMTSFIELVHDDLGGFDKLSTLLRRGDPGALDVGFHLLFFSDAGFSDDLMAALVSGAVDHPGAFLRALERNPQGLDPPLRVPAYLSKESLAEDYAGRKAELERRFAALSGARGSDPQVRRACLALIRQALSEIEKARRDQEDDDSGEPLRP